MRKNDGRDADVWSIGIILYILLSGVPPFWAEQEPQIFDAILKADLDFSTKPWPAVSQVRFRFVCLTIQVAYTPVLFLLIRAAAGDGAAGGAAQNREEWNSDPEIIPRLIRVDAAYASCA